MGELLRQLDSRELAEWLAVAAMDQEAETREGLADRATRGLEALKRKRKE